MTRLSPERLDELYAGTIALVAERGFDKITMDQIAEATRSSKATLYRQWGGKAALVAEALSCSALTQQTPDDTGSLRGDLVAMLRQRPHDLEGNGDLVAAILHAVRTDEALREAVRDQIVGGLQQQLDLVVNRSVERGEVADDNAALPHLGLLIMAPFVLRLLVDGHEVDDDYVADYLDAVVLPALGAPTD